MYLGEVAREGPKNDVPSENDIKQTLLDQHGCVNTATLGVSNLAMAIP